MTVSSAYRNVKLWRARIKDRLVIAFGGACGACKSVFHNVLYDFHHLDSDEKDFTISSRGVSEQKVADEAEKCVMLCSHCHRLFHAGLIEIPADAPRLDRDVFLSIHNRPQVEYNPCPCCGTLKKAFNKYCSYACAATGQRKIDWDSVDLPALYEELGTYRAVGLKLGVSDVAVKKRLEKLKAGRK